MTRLSWCVLACVACGGTKPVATPKPAPPDEDRVSCDRLCREEARCSGADAKSCAATCEKDVARMKHGFVAAHVGCFLRELEAHCGAFDDASRQKAHDRCFDEAVARFPHDDENQRDMATAVCDRGLRCQGLGPVGREACMQATLAPKEPETKLGQRLVDALRRERVRAFHACVAGAPCPALDGYDRAVNDCYEKTIAGGGA